VCFTLAEKQCNVHGSCMFEIESALDLILSVVALHAGKHCFPTRMDGN